MNVQLRPTWLGKTSARFKNSSAPFKQRVKLIACKPWTTPPTTLPPYSCSLPVPTPTPSTGRCSNSFHSKPAALRVVYYKRASTELPPPDEACTSTASQRSYFQHQGAPPVQPSPAHITQVTMVSKGSAYAYCQFI